MLRSAASARCASSPIQRATHCLLRCVASVPVLLDAPRSRPAVVHGPDTAKHMPLPTYVCCLSAVRAFPNRLFVAFL
jgi:hypothetical protein